MRVFAVCIKCYGNIETQAGMLTLFWNYLCTEKNNYKRSYTTIFHWLMHAEIVSFLWKSSYSVCLIWKSYAGASPWILNRDCRWTSVGPAPVLQLMLFLSTGGSPVIWSFYLAGRCCLLFYVYLPYLTYSCSIVLLLFFKGSCQRFHLTLLSWSSQLHRCTSLHSSG